MNNLAGARRLYLVSASALGSLLMLVGVHVHARSARDSRLVEQSVLIYTLYNEHGLWRQMVRFLVESAPWDFFAFLGLLVPLGRR